MRFNPLRHLLKYIVAISACFLVRLIPFRPANFEPLMGTMMPFSKRFGALAGAVLTFSSIVLYDLVTVYGSHTWTTASVYALVSIWAAYFFKNRSASRGNFVIFAILGTLVFDALTGPIVPSLIGHGQFWALTVAQVPFTVSHLAGNIIFAIVLSPIIQKYLVDSPFWEINLAKTKKESLGI